MQHVDQRHVNPKIKKLNYFQIKTLLFLFIRIITLSLNQQNDLLIKRTEYHAITKAKRNQKNNRQSISSFIIATIGNYRETLGTRFKQSETIQHREKNINQFSK